MNTRRCRPKRPDHRISHAGVAGSLFAALWMILGVVPAAAETPEEKGLAISREADRRDQGFGDSTARLKMILKNAHGETSTRILRIQTLEVPGEEEGDKTFTIFDEPRDVSGTALLSYAQILKPDDQWLYLPALKRVKRIASANKSGPFMGSEFAYEDFTAQEVGKYTYRYLRNEPCGDLECFVVERFPVYEHSGYTRMIGWTDTKEYRLQKVEFYDRKEELLKTLTFSDYRQFLGKYWRALDLHMENHQTGKSTRLSYDDYQFRTGLTENDFTRDKLKRVR